MSLGSRLTGNIVGLCARNIEVWWLMPWLLKLPLGRNTFVFTFHWSKQITWSEKELEYLWTDSVITARIMIQLVFPDNHFVVSVLLTNPHFSHWFEMPSSLWSKFHYGFGIILLTPMISLFMQHLVLFVFIINKLQFHNLLMSYIICFNMLVLSQYFLFS